MITDKQKDDIFLKIAPFELYYYHDDMVMKHAHAGTIRSLSNDFETEESFVIAVNEVLSLNSILFFNMVSKHNLSKEEFINYVSTRYNVFKENSNGNGLTDWLNYTKKLIFDKDLKYYIKEVSTTNKGAFLNWYNDINVSLQGVKNDVNNHLPLDYYALLAFYKWEKFKVGKFTRKNAVKLIENKEVPYTSDALYIYFRKWVNDEFRLKNPSYKRKDDKKLKEKIELFDKVAAGLPKDGKRLILLEIDSLTNRLRVTKLK